MKPLDMADKYPWDEEPDTIRTNTNPIFSKVVLSEDEDCEPTLPSVRNPLFQKEKQYPGIGLLIAFGTGFLFWGSVFFFACR